jgi:3-dehydroquinate dehydratase / shikimate dehydrogenase
MRDEFRYEQIGRDTGILGVIADPVAHSLSPRVHNACIRKAGLDLIYLPFRVPAEQLDDFMQACPEVDIRGLSVSLPHKEKILRNLNVLDDNVVGVRACNTVVFKNQNAYGYNTDLEAAVDVLLNAFGVEDSRNAFHGRRFLILGAGGTARTIAWGLLRREANVFITARDFRKAELLANQLKCKAADWAVRQNFPCDVLINATPCGMHPNMDETPFDDGWFTAQTLVFDVIYNPEQTMFIKFARKAGCRTITGVDMFARQAARQFELFTGQPADVEAMRYEVKRGTSAARY